MTCWRRLTEWAKAGVLDHLDLEVLVRLGAQGRLEWSRASVDTMSVRPSMGGQVGATPVDRGKLGSKLHLIWRGQAEHLADSLGKGDRVMITADSASAAGRPPRATSGR